jgi:phosphopantetheine adenylyltransferase
MPFSEVQKVLALMYTLLCVISTEESIDPLYGNEVDARVLILGTGQAEYEEAIGQNIAQQHHYSVHLRALASCRRPWTHFYYIKSKDGEAMFTDFLRIRANTELGPQAHWDGLPAGSGISSTPVANSSLLAQSSKQFLHSHSSVAVGGTFDHLHAGHKLLLTTATLLIDFGDKPNCRKSLTVGISGDALMGNKQYADEILGWDARQVGVMEFIRGVLEMSQPSQKLKSSMRSVSNSDNRSIYDEFESGLVINYVELFDPYGPTATDESISALVVSRETRTGGKAVNDKRAANGCPLLEIFEVDVLDADGRADDIGKSNFQGKISSTEIRRRLHERAAATASREGERRQDS